MGLYAIKYILINSIFPSFHLVLSVSTLTHYLSSATVVNVRRRPPPKNVYRHRSAEPGFHSLLLLLTFVAFVYVLFFFFFSFIAILGSCKCCHYEEVNKKTLESRHVIYLCLVGVEIDAGASIWGCFGNISKCIYRLRVFSG